MAGAACDGTVVIAAGDLERKRSVSPADFAGLHEVARHDVWPMKQVVSCSATGAPPNACGAPPKRKRRVLTRAPMRWIDARSALQRSAARERERVSAASPERPRLERRLSRPPPQKGRMTRVPHFLHVESSGLAQNSSIACAKCCTMSRQMNTLS